MVAASAWPTSKRKKDNVLKTKIVGFIQSIKGEQDCTTKGSYKLKAKDEKNNKRDSMKVGAGQWIMAFKDISTPSGYVPAICAADTKKPGRILRLYTPKVDASKTGLFGSITGRSGGFGLACEQVTALPK
ncbi:MAG: hypothetical protein ACK5O7_06510 [Holosporales bacterium]